MKKLPSEWIKELAESLETKYRNKLNVSYINFLDIWCEWWNDDVTQAIEFLDDIGATETEIQAYLFQNGNEEFGADLVLEYNAEGTF